MATDPAVMRNAARIAELADQLDATTTTMHEDADTTAAQMAALTLRVAALEQQAAATAKVNATIK